MTTYLKFETANNTIILVEAFANHLEFATRKAIRTDATAKHTGMMITGKKARDLQAQGFVIV